MKSYLPEIFCSRGFGYDCIILEFLSLVYVQILHLKKILGNILGVVSINSYGELVIKNKLGKFGKLWQKFEKKSKNNNFRWNFTIGYIPLNSLKSTEVSETFLETQKKVRIWIIYHQRVIEYVLKDFVISIVKVNNKLLFDK